MADRELERASNIARTAVEMERERVRLILRAIIAAYDSAQNDPQTKIPTYLHAALEIARKEAK